MLLERGDEAVYLIRKYATCLEAVSDVLADSRMTLHSAVGAGLMWLAGGEIARTDLLTACVQWQRDHGEPTREKILAWARAMG